VAAVPRAIGNSIVKGATTVEHWVVPGSETTTGSLAAPAVASASTGAPKVGPELYVASARLYEKNGNLIGAAEQYQRALKVAPDNLVALLSYAHLMDRQGKLDQATQLYMRAVKAQPHEAAPYNDLGLCYARRRMLGESANALAQAVQLQPDRELYRNNLATVLVEQNRPEEALKQLQAVQADAVAHYNTGFLLHQHGQDQLAAAYFNRSAELDPSFTEARDWSMRLAGQTPNAPYGAPMNRMAAAPNSNAMMGNRYFAQQTSAYQPAMPAQPAMPVQPGIGEMPSPEMRSLPPVQ
jgi:Tfp pilus assembly protein PilF